MAEQEPEDSEGVYIRTYRLPARTGISRSQFKRYVADGLIKVYRPSPKVALVKWADVVALIEGGPKTV